MKRVYIAGAMSADNIITALDNLRRGIQAATRIIQRGHAPFCPMLDFQFQLTSEGLTIEQYYCYSMAWLEVSDCVLVLPGSENSKGVKAEVERARELGIPIYYPEEEV